MKIGKGNRMLQNLMAKGLHITISTFRNNPICSVKPFTVSLFVLNAMVLDICDITAVGI